MVRDLVAKLDVPVASVNGAINAVASALGVRVEGCASSHSICRIIGEAGCNGYTVTGSRHSRYTESNIYLSCTRVELGLFVHVSDVLYRLHVTSVTNTIYGSYQYLQ